MKLAHAHYRMINDRLPIQRGNVKLTNLKVLNAILYVAEHGCQWRGLLGKFGPWHAVYTRASRRAKAGVLDKVFYELQERDVINIQVQHISLDSTAVKVNPDGPGALEKRVQVIMDKAYEGNGTRELVYKLGLEPVAPPKSNRNESWSYDKASYKERNEVERLFPRLKSFRRVFTRYDELDALFRFFINFAPIIIATNSVNRP